MLRVACRNLRITPEQLHTELEQGGDLQELKSGALTQKGLRLVAEALTLRYTETAYLDALPDPRPEAKRQEALAILAQGPSINYSFATDDEREPDNVILALAIRGKGTCEVRIPKSRYDGIALLEFIEKRTGNKKYGQS
jgi:hypothetical protein